MTMNAETYTSEGEAAGEPVELPEEPFDGTINRDVLHQVVTALQARSRQGTASTKNRATITGGGTALPDQKATEQQHQQTGADLAGDLVVDAHACRGHALQECDHGGRHPLGGYTRLMPFHGRVKRPGRCPGLACRLAVPLAWNPWAKRS